MNRPNNYRVRLLQIMGNLTSEGWRKTGSIGDSVIAMKHTNGNRITLIASETSIAYIKNGRLVKNEPLPSASPST